MCIHPVKKGFIIIQGQFKCCHGTDAAEIQQLLVLLFRVRSFVSAVTARLRSQFFSADVKFSLDGCDHCTLSKMSAKIPEMCFLAVTQRQS